MLLNRLLLVLYSPSKWHPMHVFVHDEWQDTQFMLSVCAKFGVIAPPV